jgi:ribosome biogenesis GTPase
VLGRRGGRLRVLTDEAVVFATLRGRLKHARGNERVVAGDRVRVDLQGDHAVITDLEKRTSVLVRRAGDTRRAQPVVANVDQVLVVAAAREPEPNPRLLDRLFVIAEANGLPSRIVLNKIDLGAEWLERLEQRCRAPGYGLIAVSARLGTGIDRVRDLLRGRATVLAGASGVGKTSLLNAVEPGLGQRTREVSRYWGTGKHTTVAAELVPIGIGGVVVDTPGLREVALWNVRPHELGPCFPEFRPYLDQCRFADCRHLKEPACAVRAAAAANAFDPDRLVSYERLLGESEAAFRSWT